MRGIIPLFLLSFIAASFAIPATTVKKHFPLPHGAGDAFSAEAKNFRVPNPKFRLPTSFEPYHYEFKVRPILENIPGDLPQWSAPGDVTIYGTCKEITSAITLHSQVAVNESSVRVTNLVTLEDVPITRHSNDTEKTFYIIELRESLAVGIQYSIFIEYVAQVHLEHLEGMYRNHYVDPNTGESKYSVASQLQAFGARKVFPSFDEPAMKATFDIALGRRSNYSSICNSPQTGTEPIPDMDGWFWDIYNSTVKMPTYLVAIVIGDFTYDESTPDLYRKPVRTYGPRHLIDAGYGTVATEIASKILVFFEEFFDVEYSMHKMDSIGIVDFPAGAMENWGLNIYREAYLLYSAPIQNNERLRRGVALTLNHELAHQWAGNLLTCSWWTDAWLNEGFATYLSYLGLNATNPEYQPAKALQPDCVRTAMRNDVLDNSHPTVLPDKGNPWDTMSYNANLVYSKGAALLRMMEGFLTLGTLQKGLQNYMKAYSFQAVNQDQLFSILTAQAQADGRLPVGATIKGIMDTWTLQKGYPLVKATLAGNLVSLTQEEYKPTNESAVYYIPIAVSTQSEPNSGNTLPQYWLHQQTNGVRVELSNQSDWVLVNSGGTGYYRVEYDEELTKRLHELISNNEESINVGSRFQLIEDYFTFAFDGRVDIATALNFTHYLHKEFEGTIWNAFLDHMNKPRRLMFERPNSEGFQSFLSEKLHGAFEGLQQRGNLSVGADNLFFAQLVDWLVSVRSPMVLSLAKAAYVDWIETPTVNPIWPIYRHRVHCAAIQGGSDENFLFALTQFHEENDLSRSELIQGLACRSDPSSIERLLGTVSGLTTDLPKQYSQAVLTAIAGVPENFAHVIPYLLNNFDTIVTYQGSPRLIANAISYLANTHSTANELSIVTSFIDLNRDKFTNPDDIQILNNAVATLESNIQWMETFGNPMNDWFNANSK